MIDIPTIMATVSNATGIVKELRLIDKGIDEAEYKLKIASLTESIADMKLAIIDLREEVSEKDQKIEKLKQFYEEKQQLVFYKGHYYTADDDGNPIGGPFCPVCILDEVKIMTTRSKTGGGSVCPKCNADLDGGRFAWPKG